MAQESPLVIPIFDLVLCLSQAVKGVDDLIPLAADNANLTNSVTEPRGKPRGFHIEEGEGVGVEFAHLGAILPQNFPHHETIHEIRGRQISRRFAVPASAYGDHFGMVSRKAR